MKIIQSIFQYTVVFGILLLTMGIPLSIQSSTKLIDDSLSELSSSATSATLEEARSHKLENYLQNLYKSCELAQYNLSFNTFKLGMVGYLNLDSQDKLVKKDVLSIVDYDKPSTKKRFYVIDLKKKTLKHHTIMAHGKKTGWNMAENFSNTPESHQSSLGFYKAAETYSGKYGYSLRLDGFEKGFNCRARERAIVMHGADYVSQDFIRKHGRLGRSWGCLSLTRQDIKPVIDKVRDGSCIYVHKNLPSYYLSKSHLLDAEKAAEHLDTMRLETI